MRARRRGAKGRRRGADGGGDEARARSSQKSSNNVTFGRSVCWCKWVPCENVESF